MTEAMSAPLGSRSWPKRPLRAGSRLERVLCSGRFAVSAELNAPDSSDPAKIYDNAMALSQVCDAINCTDSSSANSHISSLSSSAILVNAGYEPVFQINCRDRNRIAIQCELLGAAALGIKNVLCISGDDVGAGDQPEAKRVNDLDSMQLIRTVRIMRDQSMFLSGRNISVPPRFFIGAASNPFVPPYDWRPQRLAKKIEAGVDFVQTQYCYDVPLLQRFMQRVRDLGLDKQVFILVGVGPLRSDKAAEYMRTKVPGVWIPDEVVNRLAGTTKKRAEGIRLCIEIIQQVREIPGVHGVHIMAYGMEESVNEIVERSGLLNRYSDGELCQDVFGLAAETA
jgi:methylenetetrahydrofolate reductase (NADPH)